MSKNILINCPSSVIISLSHPVTTSTMFPCLHCELVSSNRNSFNRHQREHLGTGD